MKKIFEPDVNFGEVNATLQSGTVLIYPTETCYGIGCDSTVQTAVEKVFAIKGRDTQKPCILLFSDLEMLRKYAQFDPVIEQKVFPHWPGALTVLLPAKENTDLSPLVISSEGKIACRISPYPFIRKLFETFDHPLVSTSANLSGAANIYEASEIEHVFEGREISADIFIDAGDLPVCPPSTLIEIKNGVVTVLRQGTITLS